MKTKQVRTILVCLLLVITVACLKTDKVYAAEQEVLLSLHSQNPQENVPFHLTNMFPGDSVTQYYKLSVSYTGTITVNFQATVASGSEKLSEVLEMKVRRADTGELLYEGAMADMPVLGQELSTDSKSRTEDITYEITIGLSTKVGNDFQNKSLIADLSWWAEGDSQTKPSEPEGDSDTEDAVGTGAGSLVPPTGDDSRIFMWLAIMCVSMVAVLLMFAGYLRSRMTMIDNSVFGEGTPGVSKSRRKLYLGIFLVVCLFLGLGVTSAALIWQKVTVEENLFQTGVVSISLNDAQPVFQENMLFEPGMVVKKDFTLRNDSTCNVHYRLYFTNVDGDFAQVLQVEVHDGEATIFEGSLAGMNGQKSEGADGVLREGEERIMTIVFRVPEDCGNVMQGQEVLFDLNADAVQTVNNPDGLFE